MTKTYQGNHDMGEGWSEAFQLRELYGSEWIVYTRDTDPLGRYISVKAAATQRVENKANYWLYWDNEKNQLASRGADSQFLKNNRPDLFRFIRANLEDL